MPTTQPLTISKQVLITAIEHSAISHPCFSVVLHLSGSYSAAEEAFHNLSVREERALMIMDYIRAMKEKDAKRILDAAHHNPEMIHAMHLDMNNSELLAIAVIFLWKNISHLDSYQPSVHPIDAD